MEKIARLYGFENVEGFAQYLIGRAREERLSIHMELSGDRFEMDIEPLENRVYVCPHYGETREKR